MIVYPPSPLQFPQWSWGWLSPSNATIPASSSRFEATPTLSCDGSTIIRRSCRTTTSALRWTSTRTIWRAVWPSKTRHTSTTATTPWRPVTVWEPWPNQSTVTSSWILKSKRVSTFYSFTIIFIFSSWLLGLHTLDYWHILAAVLGMVNKSLLEVEWDSCDGVFRTFLLPQHCSGCK